MMNSALYLCLMIGLCSLPNSHQQPDHHEDGNENEGVTDVSHSNLPSTILDFGIQLYKQLAASRPPGQNIFFSPISITTTLALLSLGARSATHTQILEGLGFNLTATPEKDIHKGIQSLLSALTRANDQILIDMGQALFLKDDLKPLQKFLNDVHEYYKADVSTVNFKETNKAEKVINDYVEKKTQGKITQLVQGLDPDTAMMIINYILFKGNWKKPFNPELTRERDFFVNNETIVKVPMMFGMGWFDYYFDSELPCTVLQMAYNSTATALFILPDEGKFKQVQDALSGDTINRWMKNIRRGTADVYMPRFTISTTHDLKEPLNNLGIDIFSDQTDLSGITGAQDLKVSKVTHKAVLTVNEKGTEAAGATAVEMIPMSLPPTLLFGRRFIMVVLDNGNIAFVADVQNPTLS